MIREKKRIIVSLIICIYAVLFIKSGFSQTTAKDFVAGANTFLMDGKPFVIRAAELHYPRIPREYWEQRIRMCKAMGMNTICIYIFWNLHEQRENDFDFKGQNDIAEFVKLVKKNGMYCIVRPGPYVCAEWDMGGLPWWLLKKHDLKIRSLEDSDFIRRTELFFGKVGEQLKSLQVQNGGNIIMVQVENEYATFGSDKRYMELIRDAIRLAGFDKVQLFRCDWSSNFNKYTLEGVTPTLNFGAGSNIDNQFRQFSSVYPGAPKMCSEYWTGWFDHWGKPHETRSVESFIGSLKDMMERKISFSLYMAHGGTSFGHWAGANAGPYSPITTSYDYNAPIDEQGRPTDKFFAIRKLMANYLGPGETMAEIPEVYPKITIPEFKLEMHAPLLANLPKPMKSKLVTPMENLGQGWGRILYRTKIAPGKNSAKLIISGVHDWAKVFLDGKAIGILDRRRGDNTLEIPTGAAPSSLEILVDATGRVNYGSMIADRKGIAGNVEIVEDKVHRVLENWEICLLPDDYAFQRKIKYQKNEMSGPGWYKGSFDLRVTGDTFLDLTSWGKGMVWVNGHNLGRFWKVGPQQTLFLPGVWLRKGDNEVIIMDVECPKARSLSGLEHTIDNQINIDESLLHKKPGQVLAIADEKAEAEGSLTGVKAWQQVRFDTTLTGRYLCFEVLSAQQIKDNGASIAEMEILDGNGKVLNTANLKVIYADSEEVNISNSSADKIFDQQESTIWQTSITGKRTGFPHQIVVDFGEMVSVSAIRYLPRMDKKDDGMVKDFRIYLKSAPFKIVSQNKL